MSKPADQLTDFLPLMLVSHRKLFCHIIMQGCCRFIRLFFWFEVAGGKPEVGITLSCDLLQQGYKHNDSERRFRLKAVQNDQTRLFKNSNMQLFCYSHVKMKNRWLWWTQAHPAWTSSVFDHTARLTRTTAGSQRVQEGSLDDSCSRLSGRRQPHGEWQRAGADIQLLCTTESAAGRDHDAESKTTSNTPSIGHRGLSWTRLWATLSFQAGAKKHYCNHYN